MHIHTVLKNRQIMDQLLPLFCTQNFASKCHIDHLIDKRFHGMAVGVGQSKIIGKVHQVCQCFVSELSLRCVPGAGASTTCLHQSINIKMQQTLLPHPMPDHVMRMLCLVEIPLFSFFKLACDWSC